MKATPMRSRSLPFPVRLTRWMCFAAVLWMVALPASLCAQDEPLFSQARVLNTQADGLDLVVTVRWSEGTSVEPVFLSLMDRDSRAVAGDTIWPEPGADTVSILEGAFKGATSRPQHHEVEIVDGVGEALGTSYALQFGLDCENAETCRFKVRGGISAPEMIVLSPAMGDALEAAEAADAEDLLAYVADAHPELIGEVYGMGWQVAAMEQGGGGSGADCTCKWLLEVDDQPLLVQETQSRGADKDPTCGASHNLRYRRKGSDTTYTEAMVTGSSTVTPKVICWRATEVEPVSVGLGEAEATLSRVVLSPCPTPCSGSVTYVGSYDTKLTSITGSAGDKVTVGDGFTFHVGSQQVTWDLFSLSTSGTYDDQETHSRTAAAIGLLGDSARIQAGTSVALEYDPAGSFNFGGLNLACNGSVGFGSPCAEGSSEAIYGIRLQGQSSCTGSVLYEASTTVEPEPTPDSTVTDDISILVGKCHDDG